MKVIITDKLAKEGIQILKDAGLEVNEAWDIPKDKLLDIIGEYDAIIVRSGTKVRGELLERATNLKVVGRAGVGLDNVDLVKTKERGIKVHNTPAATSVSVAELAFTFLLVMTRDVITGTNAIRRGEWPKAQLKSTEIMDKTLGVIGFGRIGRQLAKRGVSFGMKVIAFDIIVPEPEPGVVFTKVIDEVFEQADYISLHTPLLPATRHMISKDQFNKMKKGVYIIDCGRGGVMDLDALYDAIKDGIVNKAGLDVFEVEPIGKHKLFELPNVFGTPHIGAQTAEGQLRAGEQVAEKVVEALKKLK